MKGIILICALLYTGFAYADIGQQLKQKSDEVSHGIVTSVAQKEHQTSERIKLQLKINILRSKMSTAKPEEKVTMENEIKKLERLKLQL
ncbi:hypothetical protein OFY73_004530 [Salmonella enterica]|nr:hypothetical protein [Salmonella enterica subsp. enterica serovar Edinburgh]EBH8904527.1 hypothetical protein [Salmonella enterica subsp. enterica serovar 6,7:b:-]EBH8909369.1 hypothetical protein [Salmonella enterica subsp. enterica serovar Santiago]EHG2694889.1 hypothetical protein [Salmonella enterica]EBH8946150.1 hypothetical protein [Salmonella enterica subsp. enterica serovar 6,7:b:-]